MPELTAKLKKLNSQAARVAAEKFESSKKLNIVEAESDKCLLQLTVGRGARDGVEGLVRFIDDQCLETEDAFINQVGAPLV